MIDMKDWATAPASWIASAGQSLGETILSSRVRLARNLSAYPFPHKAAPRVQKDVLTQVLITLKNTPSLKNSIAYDLKNFNALEGNFLMERQLISRDFLEKKGEKGLVVTAAESLSIMINEEDHVRAASFKPGLALDEAWEALSRLDDETSDALNYAFDTKHGYLTACPTNTGTGLRASSLLHLPALALSGQAQNVLSKLENQGVSVRGFYGEGTRAIGDLFQISNTRTLGETEQTLINGVETIVKTIAEMEKKAQDHLFKKENRQRTEDRLLRSLGTLQSARLLDFEEGMQLLSHVRLALKLNLTEVTTLQDATNLFFLIQPAHTWIREGKNLDAPQAEAHARAAYIRLKFQGKN